MAAALVSWMDLRPVCEVEVLLGRVGSVKVMRMV